MDRPAPARILVTGATGFVGGYLVPALSARFPATRIVRLGPKEPETADADVVPVDLLDSTAVDAAVAATKPDVIIHLAAQSSVADANIVGDLTWSVNLTGSLHLALAIAAHVPRSTLLYASSAEVYGASFRDSPVCETTPLMPMTAYGKSKALAERMFADVLPPSARLIVARPFNHSGPGQRETFVLPSFVAQVARIEAGRQSPHLAAGNLDVRRDFLDVRDVVEAYIALVAAGSILPPRFTCNIASGQAHPIRYFLTLLQRLSKTPFDIVVDPSNLRPVDVAVAYAEPTLLRATVGWIQRHDITDTLFDMLADARSAESKPIPMSTARRP